MSVRTNGNIENELALWTFQQAANVIFDFRLITVKAASTIATSTANRKWNISIAHCLSLHNFPCALSELISIPIFRFDAKKKSFFSRIFWAFVKTCAGHDRSFVYLVKWYGTLANSIVSAAIACNWRFAAVVSCALVYLFSMATLAFSILQSKMSTRKKKQKWKRTNEMKERSKVQWKSMRCVNIRLKHDSNSNVFDDDECALAHLRRIRESAKFLCRRWRRTYTTTETWRNV